MQPVPPQPPTFRAAVAFDDGTPVRGAVIAITSLASGRQVEVLVTDRDGYAQAALDTGEHALAVTAARGFAWIETQPIPNTNLTITLSRSCHAVVGTVTGSTAPARINLARHSRSTGDVFVGAVRTDGGFAVCVPEGHYGVFLTGQTISYTAAVTVPTTTPLRLRGFADHRVKQAPIEHEQVSAEMSGLVADIVASDARLVGLGEATHGTAELVSARGALTLELVRRAGARLVLVEIDAIAAVALDDYINGTDLDIGAAVAALGFWVTDTYEFLRVLSDLRQHNATTPDKVHVWGIDVQNTELPVEVLVSNAATLSLTPEEVATLRLAADRRGAQIRALPAAARARLDALLSRLGTPRSAGVQDLRLAVAARSLAVQLGYLDGDTPGLYGQRRDAGMASLASFLVAQTRARRGCVWAHAGHVATEPQGGDRSMGQHLAAVPEHRYYPVGFYVYQGSSRAWDAAGEIGVISHALPPAPSYTVEGAMMAATGAPEIAWLPVRRFPAALRAWIETPRFVRELGAVYIDEADTMTLREVRAAFAAVVVVRSGHDSSPTPSGVRKVTRE